MTVDFDSNDPIGSLERAGVKHSQSDTTSSSSFLLAGLPIGASTTVGERHVWQLPAEAQLQAVFSPEKLSKKLVKFFKKELQLGDPAFDHVVYIDTADKDAAARFLGDAAHREAVLDFVSEGGRVAVDKDKLVFDVKGGATAEQLAKMARLVSGVMSL